jgi:hypothetical protein
MTVAVRVFVPSFLLQSFYIVSCRTFYCTMNLRLLTLFYAIVHPALSELVVSYHFIEVEELYVEARIKSKRQN